MLQSLRQRDSVKDSNSFPRTQGNVVDPAAVRSADRLLRPFVHALRSLDIPGVAAAVRHPQQRIHSIAAASVNQGTCWTGESAVKRGIANACDLQIQQAIAPAFQKLGIKIGASCGRRLKLGSLALGSRSRPRRY